VNGETRDRGDDGRKNGSGFPYRKNGRFGEERTYGIAVNSRANRAKADSVGTPIAAPRER